MTRRHILTLAGNAAAAGQWHDVKSFGAKADGRTNDAAAIQKAVDACAAAGGGVAGLASGVYRSGTIVLKSNVVLWLSPGATLSGSGSMADYGSPHLIYAQDADNVAIEGGGTIDGNGGSFRDANLRPLASHPSPLARFVRCHGVRVENVQIRNAPAWTLHTLACDGVAVRGISIVNPTRALNTDGIDVDSSRNVRISDCYIEAGDDCIVLKTTGRADGPPSPCENVTVTNCVLISGASALKLGTESRSSIRHCVFSNCVVRDSWNGIGLFAKDGGTYENIRFSNISIELAPPRPWHHNEWPIFVDIEKRAPDSPLSRVRDVAFSDISIRTRGRILIQGMPERHVEQVSLHNIDMRVTGFEDIAKARKPSGGRTQTPTREIDYGPAPAAIILANTSAAYLRDIRIIWDFHEPPPERHAVYAAKVKGLSICGLSAGQAVPGGQLAVIGLDNVTDVLISQCVAAPGTGTFAGLNQTPEAELSMADSRLKNTERAVSRGWTYIHIP